MNHDRPRQRRGDRRRDGHRDELLDGRRRRGRRARRVGHERRPRRRVPDGGRRRRDHAGAAAPREPRRDRPRRPGTATSWNPSANDTVEVGRGLGLDGSTPAASFTAVNNGATRPRDRLAAFDMNLGNATTWNPGVHNGAVLALAVSGYDRLRGRHVQRRGRRQQPARGAQPRRRVRRRRRRERPRRPEALGSRIANERRLRARRRRRRRSTSAAASRRCRRHRRQEPSRRVSTDPNIRRPSPIRCRGTRT